MSATRAFFRHLSLGVLGVVTVAVPAAGQAGARESSSYTVLLNGAQVGVQTASLTSTPDGWLLTSSGSLGAPFNIITKTLEVAYATDWQPQRLVLQGSVAGEAVSLTTTFGAATATSELVRGAQKATNTQVISPRALVIPDNFFGTYVALAARLAGAEPGSALPIYRVPEGEVVATVDRVTARRLITPEGPVPVRDFALTMATPRGSFPMSVWVDERQRLARLALPVSSVVVIRDDLTSVMTREDHGQNPGDQAVFIQANGFTIGATVTRPTGVTGRAPAVILVAGPSSPGRERMTAGVPVFARLAGMLADDGYLVVRFDARGSGQSGGRLENADLGFYRDDLLAVVQWLRRQPYADSNRLAVVGYADSAPIAMMAAEREDRIKGVVLLAAHGRSGREVVLEQQRRVLAQLQIPDAERTRRVALQNAINDAVITGKGWESISTDVRRDADTPWFRSWLLFDPAVSLQKMKQPVLIVRAGLDAEIGAADADRLEALARDSERRSAPLTQKVVIESANQAFAIPNAGGPASTASADVISRELGRAIADWFRRVAPAR